MSKIFKPSREDLAENPKTPENLLRGFQGRDIQHRMKTTISNLSDAQAFVLGRSNIIYYKSDKRDPKDPDGEGAQGFDKHFYHEQHPESYLYAVCKKQDLEDFELECHQDCVNAGLVKKLEEKGLVPTIPLPPKLTLVQLAQLEKVDLSINAIEIELIFRGFNLFVWDDYSTLMAAPKSKTKLNVSKVYLWASKHTFVNWRGIIN